MSIHSQQLLRIVSVLLLLGFAQKVTSETDADLLYDTFPEDFMWGTATSSYQIEGAWNLDGKKITICNYLNYFDLDL